MPTSASPTHDDFQGQLLELFLFVGSEWILYLLLFLSIISIAVAIERIVHFFRHHDDLEALQSSLYAHLTDDDLDAAGALLQNGRSHVAAIALSGLGSITRGVGAVEEVVAGAVALERLKMERGLAFLGTLGNNAPFIGLFGTVMGIIRAFRDLSANTLEGSSAVMAGIAEALIATAVGLFVALPAVAVFNFFQRYIKSQLASADALVRVLLAHLKTERQA